MAKNDHSHADPSRSSSSDDHEPTNNSQSSPASSQRHHSDTRDLHTHDPHQDQSSAVDLYGGENADGLSQLFSDTFLHADALYYADIGTLNSSGVTGEAVLALNGNVLTVEIAASGLDPNQVHPVHIHGFPSGTPDAQVPTAADDADHDGFIEVAEGAQAYGPILLSLKHDGAFPTAPDGTFIFNQSYVLPSTPVPNADVPALSEVGLTPDIPLDLREIVIHGLTLPHDGSGLGSTNANSIAPNEADGTPGYKTVLPVAAGEIQASHGVSALQHFANDLESHFQGSLHI